MKAKWEKAFSPCLTQVGSLHLSVMVRASKVTESPTRVKDARENSLASPNVTRRFGFLSSSVHASSAFGFAADHILSIAASSVAPGAHKPE